MQVGEPVLPGLDRLEPLGEADAHTAEPEDAVLALQAAAELRDVVEAELQSAQGAQPRVVDERGGRPALLEELSGEARHLLGDRPAEGRCNGGAVAERNVGRFRRRSGRNL